MEHAAKHSRNHAANHGRTHTARSYPEFNRSPTALHPPLRRRRKFRRSNTRRRSSQRLTAAAEPAAADDDRGGHRYRSEEKKEKACRAASSLPRTASRCCPDLGAAAAVIELAGRNWRPIGHRTQTLSRTGLELTGGGGPFEAAIAFSPKQSTLDSAFHPRSVARDQRHAGIGRAAQHARPRAACG